MLWFCLVRGVNLPDDPQLAVTDVFGLPVDTSGEGLWMDLPEDYRRRSDPSR